MTNKINVVTIIGTRPELIKMSQVIKLFDKYTNHTIIHTGQNYDYELNEIFYTDLNIRKPDLFLNVKSDDVGSQISKIIDKSYKALKKINPDGILIYGDTNSGLSAISAKKLKIPIFHMEAGNRSFDSRVPEEVNRKIIDHLSDINFVLTEHARGYLCNEGIRKDKIILTGTHLYEVLNASKNNIISSKILDSLNLSSRKFFLVSCHREENVDNSDRLKLLIKILNNIAQSYNFDIIFSTHPRTKKNLNSISDIKIDKRIQFLKPFSFSDYIRLQIESACVISDSGSITEEASILGFPSLMIRDSHERPEGMDFGSTIMTGLSMNKLTNSLKFILNSNINNEIFSLNNIYQNKINVSEQIYKCFLSYLDYVNYNTWHKRS